MVCYKLNLLNTYYLLYSKVEPPKLEWSITNLLPNSNSIGIMLYGWGEADIDFTNHLVHSNERIRYTGNHAQHSTRVEANLPAHIVILRVSLTTSEHSLLELRWNSDTYTIL